MTDSTRLLANANPTLAAEYSNKNPKPLDTVFISAGWKAIWECATCAYEWSAVVASRSGGRGCPNCAGKVANETNSLLLLHPGIAAEYAEDLNKQDVSSITHRTTKRYWWRCSKDPKHEWQTSVLNRVKQGDGCPMCSGRYPTEENNLAVVHPEIAKEFDVEANFPLTPYDFTSGSHKKVAWKCEKGHKWESSVGSRFKGGKKISCAYCIGKCATDDNHLGVTHPEIAKQYHPTLNTVPFAKVRFGSKTKRWWQCESNPRHIWEAAPQSRTRKIKSSGCPQCSPTPRTSKIEKQIKEYLKETRILNNIPTMYKTFVPVHGDKRSEVDIFGLHGDYKVVVEYDSWWWHSGKGSQKPYNTNEERDIRKTRTLIESGYVVIRIREVRQTEILPLIRFDNIKLYQIQWNQDEGLDSLADKISIYLQSI